mmetsp:Transcript_71542/g.225938  ORF Transcript_71542/g.225938 Transcript_71542/m.225938 type:complete len:84 (+) Transcript_71542:1243-1494(+)
MINSAEFDALIPRLHLEAARQYRDTWVCCDQCGAWRELSHEQRDALSATSAWYCSRPKIRYVSLSNLESFSLLSPSIPAHASW